MMQDSPADALRKKHAQLRPNPPNPRPKPTKELVQEHDEKLVDHEQMMGDLAVMIIMGQGGM